MTSTGANAGICRAIMDRLSEYIDGELTAQERSDVDAHLRGCATCRRYLGRLRFAVKAAKSLASDDEDDSDFRRE